MGCCCQTSPARCRRSRNAGRLTYRSWRLLTYVWKSDMRPWYSARSRSFTSSATDLS